MARTREIDPVEELLAYASPGSPMVWLRRGDGMIGIGEALRLGFGGRDVWSPPPGSPSPSPADAWRLFSREAEIDDPVGLPGTGLVAFGSFAFDERSRASSRLIVPETVIGRHGDRFWMTRIGVDEEPTDAVLEPAAFGPYWSATIGPGALDPAGYQDAVRGALGTLADGEVSKVVIARDLEGTIPAGADLRRLARALADGYPDTWAFAVDGLIGASPETLVTVSDGIAAARVLAGTTPRGADPDADAEAAIALSTSAKDLDEHQYAVQSVLASLRPHTSALSAGEQPFALKLPNVWHLATDVAADVAPGTSALDLVEALHPTAAVAGTPTDAALGVIRRLEPFDRGRYAGPVGWIDAAGDGEWAIALRCAQIDVDPRGDAKDADRIRVSAFAGAGIVAGSDPESELVETRVKFRPIIDALA
ncbi:isochorismate synthase [Microbacterium thalassium]|uniref:isochorismate synthase n=1 Tax=Microbacterium thalassium TaxID=362649 RepID=A0A7X0FTK6_9MICO|nr:isochorismate synthase [Microbacterium thalassium]MBB6392932.1 menaquinone-specific isochorismate synthase [Microbacterium thalassium]GLK22837.1 isochorismate synthase [Microbacterium thalassium]